MVNGSQNVKSRQPLCPSQRKQYSLIRTISQGEAGGSSGWTGRAGQFASLGLGFPMREMDR